MTDRTEHKPPVEDGLVDRLRELRAVLKSGDYDGADLMRAWCAMADAADALASRDAEMAALKDRLAEYEQMRTCVRATPFGQLGDMPDGGEG
jgi:MoxR-like ATPase